MSRSNYVIAWLIAAGLMECASAAAGQPSPQISVHVTGLEKDELGGTINVQFQVTGMPRRAPLDPATAEPIDGFSETERSATGKLGPRWLDDSRLDLIVISPPNTVRLKGAGFIVVPPGQTMPFGVNLEGDRFRVVFPLYVPEAQPTGSVTFRPLQAGSFHLTVSHITVTAAGELRAKELLFDQTHDLKDRAPVIIVEDRFTAPKPDVKFFSPSGQHELWVYKDRFDVFNRESAGLIFSLVGTNPTFSPTGRFITYDDGRNTVVIDILDRRPEVKLGNRIAVAFLSGDAYLYTYLTYGKFEFLSPFIDSNYTGGMGSWTKGLGPLMFSSLACHVCSILPTSVRLDISSGLLVLDPSMDTDPVNKDIYQPEPDPGKRYHDFVSLLTRDRWRHQLAESDAAATNVRGLFHRRAEFGLSVYGIMVADRADRSRRPGISIPGEDGTSRGCGHATSTKTLGLASRARDRRHAFAHRLHA